MVVYLMFGSAHPAGRRKPSPGGLALSEVAGRIGGTVEILRDYIRRGCIPSPIYVGGYPVFSPEYVGLVSKNGVCLDGTFAVTPCRWLTAKNPLPPAERPAAQVVAKKRRHPLHGKPGPKRKGGVK